MYYILKTSLAFWFLFIFSMNAVQADCIVTSNNFSKSSRVIYVNPTNGSDQLAKIYNYNLGNQRNPYEPKGIVAFQNLNEALAASNSSNGDLILVKTASTWTNYDVWAQNTIADFNKQSSEVSGFSQSQCQGENLTWVPDAVIDTQSTEIATSTEFSNISDITVAKVELTTKKSTSNQVSTTSPKSTSPTTSKRSFGGSSSSGSDTGSDSLSPSIDTTSDFQLNDTIVSSNDSTQTAPENLLTETSLQNEVIAELDPSLTDDLVTDQTAPENLLTETQLQNEVNAELDASLTADLVTEENVAPVESEQDIVSYAPECTINAPWENAIQTYPKDSEGWSIIKPDIETKIVYVSSSEGDDITGQIYNGLGMDDPFNPGVVQAFKTVEKAYEQIRDGKPDWILLKKGDTFELEKTLWLKTGKSQNAHIVLGAYGDKNDKRPVVDTKEGNVIQGLKNRSFNTIMGIEFYASKRDPSSPSFFGWGNKGKTAFTNLASNVDGNKILTGIHIENNRFNYYSIAIVMGSMENAVNTNIVIRRNEILNSYSEDNHSQGIFLSEVNGGLIEENILDHNGWYQQRPSTVPLNTKTYGYATYFNHNSYINQSDNLIIRKNLSSRSSSIGMKFTSNANTDTQINTIKSQNILLDSNVILEGEVGFSLGGNKDFNNGYRWDNIQVVGNVLSNMGKSQPTNRNIAWNIDVNDWKSGTVCGNYMIDQSNPSLTNLAGIMVNGQIGDVSIDNNTVINQAQSIEVFTTTIDNELSSSENVYIFEEASTNNLDAYVNKQGYSGFDSYIKDALNNLQNNPSNYYNIEEVLNYMKNASILKKLQLM